MDQSYFGIKLHPKESIGLELAESPMSCQKPIACEFDINDSIANHRSRDVHVACGPV